MTTKINRPNPFVTVWAESNNSKKFTVYESESEAKANAAHPARASMDLGFPEITMKSAMTGGQPPWGQDHNGILNRITKTLQWIQAGGTAIFDKDLSDKIGGYPQGAILQDINDPTILWFSKKTSNTFNPKYAYDPDKATDDDGGSRTREKWWDKLSIADIKDLQERLATAEGNIYTNTEDIATNTKDIATNTNAIYKINTDVTKSDVEVNSFPDVYAKLGKKASQTDLDTANTKIGNLENNKANQDYVNETFALKEGSCSQAFSANVMRAGQYRFCNYSKTEDGYITQNLKSMDFYGDNAFTFLFSNFTYLAQDITIPTNSVLRLSCSKDDNKKNYITESYCTATNSIFEGAYVIIKSQLALEDHVFQITNTKQKLTWQMSHEKGLLEDGKEDKDNPENIDLVTTVYNKDETYSGQVLRLSYTNFNVHAPLGSFISDSHADIAEYYQADREGYEPGTLMCHGVDTEVTLCQSIDQSDDFFGVVSTNPAYVMNGKGKNNTNPVLIALNGKVPVKVKGIVKCGDKITIGQDGYGVVSQNKNDVIVGRAKENKESEEVDLVSCYVQAHM